MVVRLRLSRQGPKNSPFYHLVAIRDSARRDARPIEKLGEYDPVPKVVANPATGSQSSFSERASGTLHPAQDRRTGLFTSGIASARNPRLEKRVEWNRQRIAYWLQVGAQPTDVVARLLYRAGVIDEHGRVQRDSQPEAGAQRISDAEASSSQQVKQLESEAQSVRASSAPEVKSKLPAILQLIAESKQRAAESAEAAKRGETMTSSSPSQLLPPSRLSLEELEQQPPHLFRPDQRLRDAERRREGDGQLQRALRAPLRLSQLGVLKRNKGKGTPPHRPQLPPKKANTESEASESS
ncbi:Mitochondrial/chloroplast ribosomal protein S16 [Ceraceosorus bombacis]|uniref:Mitochondrial/chloroplast ribosomal protein S16 n=1 Tax=Ceraceosorus bombacis TaxID=401625 RepID=A0A0N7L9X3_9BASI|nr:Mitochondrial/chloroplast ribosomal protein S16 [Ceraceosorus bombacis]